MTTTVHNIIVGKLWIEQSGEVRILKVFKFKTEVKLRKHVNFIAQSYRKPDLDLNLRLC